MIKQIDMSISLKVQFPVIYILSLYNILKIKKLNDFITILILFDLLLLI